MTRRPGCSRSSRRRAGEGQTGEDHHHDSDSDNGDNDDDSVHGPHGQSRGHRKLTRQRREIFPDYEKRVQNRVFGEAEEDEEEEEENSDNSILEKVKTFQILGTS